MRISFLYLLFLSVICLCCETKNRKGVHRLSKKVIYIIEGTPAPVAGKSSQIADTSYIEYVFRNYDLVNIKTLDSSIQVDLRYSGTNNFLKYNLYDGLRNAYFNCETAVRVAGAQYLLKQINPDYSLMILDAARPQHIQQMMWDSLKMHPDVKQFYLSKPEETSLHNYGGAVDVTIVNLKTGKLLDMGTDYDFFGKLSEPIYEKKFLASGELSETAYKNRLLLREVMQRAGLNPITSEWWHFSICKKEEAASRFRLIK